jgi:hypothetical protein
MKNFICLLVWTAILGTTPAFSEGSGPLMLSRYSGIVGLIQLGDTEQAILSRVKWTNKRADLPKSHGLAKMRFSHMMLFPEGGVRAYFRNDKVALIEVQNPFSGEVQGTRLSVFKLTSTQKAEKWDDVIQNELGRQPRGRIGNGAFNSEAFLYPWGDVSFNASGLNEMAIYRDPEIAKYRQTHFGPKVEMWAPN